MDTSIFIAGIAIHSMGLAHSLLRCALAPYSDAKATKVAIQDAAISVLASQCFPTAEINHDSNSSVIGRDSDKSTAICFHSTPRDKCGEGLIWMDIISIFHSRLYRLNLKDSLHGTINQPTTTASIAQQVKTAADATIKLHTAKDRINNIDSTRSRINAHRISLRSRCDRPSHLVTLYTKISNQPTMALSALDSL
jgi:hypothetical protein